MSFGFFSNKSHWFDIKRQQLYIYCMSSSTHIERSSRSFSMFFLPRIGDAVFIVIFLSVLFSGSQLINSDGDLGRHLTVGQYIIDAHRIPTRDIFSYTMYGQPLIPHEWLSEVIFSLSYRFLGMDGVILLCALILSLTLVLIYRQTLQRSGLRILSLAFTLMVWTTISFHWLARPHLLTMLMIVIWIGGMERLRKGQNRFWWLLPALMCVWVNLHGAFIAGFAVWIIYFAGWLWEHWFLSKTENRPVGSARIWILVGVLSGIASLINPSGWKIWGNSVGYISNQFLVDHTIEYQSPNFHNPIFWPFALLVLLSIFLFGINHLRLKPTSLLLLIFWTAMGLYSVRNIPLYALIAVPILAEGSAESLRIYFPSKAKADGGVFSVFTVILTTLIILGGRGSGLTPPNNTYSQKLFPVEAANWLMNNPPSGNMYNHFIWGGYLLYRLWPEQLVFIDGQTDFYGEDLTRQYLSVMLGEADWQDVLKCYQINWAIVPTNSLISRLLQNELNWQIAYQDETAVVLEQE